MLRRRALAAALLTASVVAVSGPALADGPDPRTIAFRFVPSSRAQLALWIERADGTFLETVALTRAVGLRGIGNRPGALPVWAHRRAAAPGARAFPRVIFQSRTSEGWASRSASDFSVDDYFCLSFQEETTRREALDAVTCASTFNSDKGRYLGDADAAAGYAEPWQDGDTRTHRVLGTTSLYPPRRDATRCTSVGCFDHADVDRYDADTRRVMPEIDAVTMATPVGGTEKTIFFEVPAAWENGDYIAWLEVSVEGDYNDTFNDRTFPTPTNAGSSADWDVWAMGYGYPYRGQPSIVYRIPFTLGETTSTDVVEPAGYGSVDGTGADGGAVHAMDGQMTNDPLSAPGSGVDRLRVGAGGYRFRVEARSSEFCRLNTPPGAITGMSVAPFGGEKHSHDWGHLTFVIPNDDAGVEGYDVRVSTSPIVDTDSFMHAEPANAASLESEELVIPSGDPGTRVDVDFGGMMPSTHYYVGVRAYDACSARGPLGVAEVTTSEIHFTVVSPCFVATAAYGTPMAHEIGALRRFRDRHLMTHAPGRALVRAYYAVGPTLARAIRGHDALRAAVREALAPLVGLARWADGGQDP